MPVTIVNDNEFIKELESDERIVVKFFTDWCGSCRIFRPKFIRMSDEERFNGVKFLDMNAEQNPVARKMAVITHFPSFAIFRNGKHLETIATTKEDVVAGLIIKLCNVE
jgi:thiol-disulfide isomerase/thioredoxin